MERPPQVPPLSFERVYEMRNETNPRLVDSQRLAKYRLSAEASAGQASGAPVGAGLARERCDGPADARSQSTTMHALPFCATTNFVKGMVNQYEKHEQDPDKVPVQYGDQVPGQDHRYKTPRGKVAGGVFIFGLRDPRFAAQEGGQRPTWPPRYPEERRKC